MLRRFWAPIQLGDSKPEGKKLPFKVPKHNHVTACDRIV